VWSLRENTLIIRVFELLGHKCQIHQVIFIASYHWCVFRSFYRYYISFYTTRIHQFSLGRSTSDKFHSLTAPLIFSCIISTLWIQILIWGATELHIWDVPITSRWCKKRYPPLSQCLIVCIDFCPLFDCWAMWRIILVEVIVTAQVNLIEYFYSKS